MGANTNYSKIHHRIFLLVCLFLSGVYFLGKVGMFIGDGINIPCGYILFFYYIAYLKNINPYLGAIAIISIISVIFSFIVIGGGFGSVLSNIAIVLLIFVFANIRFEQNDIRYFVRALFFFHVYYVLYVVLFRYSDGYIGSYNSNSVAIQALIHMAFFILYPSKKLIQLFLIISSFLIILYTQSRTALGSSLIILFFYLWRKKMQSHPIAIKTLFWVIAIGGLIFSFLYSTMLGDYAYLSNISEMNGSYSDKSIFTGREKIWGLAWDLMLKDPLYFLLGIGSHFYKKNDSTGYIDDANFHNSFLTIFICCGAIGYLLIQSMLYKFFSIDIKNKQLPNSILYKAIYISFMFFGMFESVLFTGHYSVLIYLLLCCSLDNGKRAPFCNER